MIIDKKRIDWIKKEILRSGYSLDIKRDPPFERMALNTQVGSGPYQKEYKGFNLREIIDKLISNSQSTQP